MDNKKIDFNLFFLRTTNDLMDEEEIRVALIIRYVKPEIIYWYHIFYCKAFWKYSSIDKAL